jgi:hypothetical protein
MRWVLACMLVVTATASARVIRVPAIARACDGNRSWSDVLKCTGTYGDAKLAKALPHARVVHIPGRRDDKPSAPGVYLFVEEHGAWHLGGLYEGEAEVLGLARVTLGSHAAYRVDLGDSLHMQMSVDDVTSTPAVYVRREQLYCSGLGYSCSTVMTACDVLVGGKAIATFRGTVTSKDTTLHIAGDRTRAGRDCDQPEEVPVYFPST